MMHVQGHVCPSGARCFHLSKGKCWFKGGKLVHLLRLLLIADPCADAMHPTMGPAELII